MKFFVLTISFSFLLIACKNNSESPMRPEIDIIVDVPKMTQTSFSKDTQLVLYSGRITLPKNWRLANDDTLFKIGDATFRYRFHNKNGKLIFLQYGLNTVGNPSEPNVLPAIFRKGYVNNEADTSGIIFTDNPRLAEIRKKSNYLYSFRNITGFKATFFAPKGLGKGYTGIYIDSIGQVAGNIADLILYADGLDSLESQEFEKVSRSLIIKNFR